MTRLAFIGGGGFAKEALEIADLCGHEVVGYCGDTPGILIQPYWGRKESLLSRRHDFDAVCVTFGSTDRKSVKSRREVVSWVVANGFRGETLVSPHAILSRGVTVAEGTVVAHRVVVSVYARIGAFVILNTGAIIGHDAVIGDNTTIAPGAFIGGASTIGRDSLVGPGTNVLQGLTVGEEVIVGVASTIVRDVPSGATVLPLRSKVLTG